ncbi:hypothetical protein [Streptomyces sp. NPDC002580]|uniref:hypothetical protein n=1 Tax=Streptomyces sp. NPDC002580 TaxID=3364653 RepID=UPI0036A91064
MSAAAGRVGRFYTSARRHPWVLGKVADWSIPLGPYTPAQIAVAVGGCFLLVKTIGWWSWMGPVPIAAWLLAVWAVRRPKVAGRAPVQAALGWMLLGRQPRGGRIGGHAARDRAPRPLLGGFTIEDASPRTGAGTCAGGVRRLAGQAPRLSAASVHRSAERRPPSAVPAAPGRPVSGVQQLLTLAEQAGGVR